MTKIRKILLFATGFLMFLILVSQANAQPSDWIRLTTNPHSDLSPDYSPDEEKIAFQRARSDHWHRDIWIMNADGSNEELLIEDLYGGGAGWPDWSPDGTKIVFSEYHNGYRSDVVVYDVNSKERRALVENWKPNITPRWSPDGSKILFNHEDEHIPGGLWNLYTINVTDGQIEKITNTSTYHYAYPNWSPDGSKIAVSRANTHIEPHDIFLMNADGSNEVKLVDNGIQPEFFPDGERILFRQNSNLFSVNIDGTNLVQLTDCPSDWTLEGGTVSPDGREIAFAARRVSEEWTDNIYKILLSPPISLSLTPNTGFASTTVIGSGFSPSSEVTITWDETEIPTLPSPLITDSDGDFTAIISVPTQTEPGTHTVKATDESENWANATFTVINMTGPQGPQGPLGETRELSLLVDAFTIAVSITAICLATIALLKKKTQTQ